MVLFSRRQGGTSCDEHSLARSVMMYHSLICTVHYADRRRDSSNNRAHAGDFAQTKGRNSHWCLGLTTSARKQQSCIVGSTVRTGREIASRRAVSARCEMNRGADPRYEANLGSVVIIGIVDLTERSKFKNPGKAYVMFCAEFQFR